MIELNADKRSDWIPNLSKQLLYWNDHGELIPLPQTQPELLNLMVDPDDSVVIDKYTHLVRNLFHKQYENENAFAMDFMEMLILIGPVRFMRIGFDIRITKGTHVLLSHPFPLIDELRDCFNSPHPKSKEKGVQLTVGARALAKHCHRCLDGFWGSCDGPTAEKNRLAESKFRDIIDDCVWKNIHVVPIGKQQTAPNFEYRNSKGYGMRFQIEEDEMKFRGFLEPIQENGHENGWVHGGAGP